MSAMRCATAWNVASGRPNCSRVATCLAVRSSAPATAPAATAAAPAAASWYRSATAALPGSRPATGAASSLTVYSGASAEAGVLARITPAPAASTTTTAVPSAPRPVTVAGTRIQLDSPAYGTPTLVPVTVPEPLAPSSTATV